MVVNINKAYSTATGWKGWDEDAAAADTPLMAEGFQAAGAPAATCPAGATTGFPVSLGFSPSESIYDAVLDDIIIDIQYGRSATPPSWSKGADQPLTIEFGGANETTLLYKAQQHKYTLETIQIADATHNSWLLQNGAQNKEDIIFYFKKSSSDVTADYIFIVIPIIKSSAYTVANSFLQGLYNNALQGPFSIRDCFPAKDTLFLRYSSCLTASSGGTRNVDVFVSSVGLPVNEATMRSVFNSAVGKKACINASTSSFCPVAPPVSLQSSQIFSASSATFTNNDDIGTGFTKKVTASRGIVEIAAEARRTSSQVIRADQTGSYKCLPFNPDNEVKDGQIKVDLDSGLVVNDVGEPLSQVLEARAKLIREERGAIDLKPGTWEKTITIVLVVIFSLMAAALLGYMIWSMIKGQGGAAGAAAAPTGVQVPRPGSVAAAAAAAAARSP